MSSIHGEGEYRYEVINGWAKVPPEMAWREVGAVAVDSQDNVYVFNRGPHPMLVFDREGNFLRSWGESTFARAHGAHYAPDDTLYLTDDGKLILSWGGPGTLPGEFNIPHNICCDADG